MSGLVERLREYANELKACDKFSRQDEVLHQAADRIEQLEGALRDVMIGGNYLANQLVHRLGAEFPEKYPPDMENETVLRRLCATVEFDVWCCWAAIMRARDTLEAKL